MIFSFESLYLVHETAHWPCNPRQDNNIHRTTIHITSSRTFFLEGKAVTIGGRMQSKGWHKNQIRRSFQVNQCLSTNSKFIGELNFVIHRWSKYLRQWKCYIFFTLNRGRPEMFSNNRAIPKYWGFLQNKIAFGAWLWPIGAEMENKPSNCWLWLKANENAQEPIGS